MLNTRRRTLARTLVAAALLALVLPHIMPVPQAFARGGPLGDLDAPVTVEMVGQTETVRPGETAILGFKFDVTPTWHLYWREPGEAGIAPTFGEWQGLPAGVTPGRVLWPTPHYENADGGGHSRLLREFRDALRAHHRGERRDRGLPDQPAD